MPGLIDSARAVLSSAEKRLEASAQNVANASTPGFKRAVSFSQALDKCDAASACGTGQVLQFDFRQGQLRETGAAFDLAIYGPALLQLRAGDQAVYSRGGSFARGEDGTLIDAAGHVLQQAGGGDLVLSGSGDPEILGDGTVLEGGLPTARIALFEAADTAALSAAGGTTFTTSASLDEAEGSILRQGFIETSNVVMSDEMIAMMASVRQAEGGGRLVQFYDELIGQAITTFSRNSR